MEDGRVGERGGWGGREQGGSEEDTRVGAGAEEGREG